MHITLAEAQAWLEGSRVTLGLADTELEASASEVVFSQLRGRFDVSPWVDETTTPKLVRTVIAMLHDAWYVQRVHADQDDLSPYARKLESLAMTLLGGLAGGSIDLDIVIPRATFSLLAFYPMQADTDAGTAPRAFSMGSVF
jgi:hypothetical protein